MRVAWVPTPGLRMGSVVIDVTVVVVVVIVVWVVLTSAAGVEML